MSESVYLDVSWGWCGINWSHTLNCWMVLSVKTSLLYLLLCSKWTNKLSVTCFILTYVLSCWLRFFAVLVARNILRRGCVCFVLNILSLCVVSFYNCCSLYCSLCTGFGRLSPEYAGDSRPKPSQWMRVARHHPHRTHDLRSGFQDHPPPIRKLGAENHMLQLNI